VTNEPERGQILLPFAEKEYVDVGRTAYILGVSQSTVYRLAATSNPSGGHLIDLVEYRPNARKRVLYASIVRFCDDLRTKYRINDRRPPLTNPLFRHRDEDLLPFPMSDTMASTEALHVLGYETRRPLVNLIEEGAFQAYRLVDETPWRISRNSFSLFLQSIRGRAPSSGVPYRSSGRTDGL
jgi:hypothetical protein